MTSEINVVELLAEYGRAIRGMLRLFHERYGIDNPVKAYHSGRVPRTGFLHENGTLEYSVPVRAVPLKVPMEDSFRLTWTSGTSIGLTPGNSNSSLATPQWTNWIIKSWNDLQPRISTKAEKFT
jgi:hypothetical protein